MDQPIAQDKLDWMEAVLGMRLDGSRAAPGVTASGSTVRAKQVDRGIPPPSGASLFDRPPSGAAIQPPFPLTPLKPYAGANGRQLQIARASDGRVALIAPPAPVREVTFSGGGGKGAALPGAVKALHESGMMKNITQLSGASVGSMTAAMVAAGSNPAEFSAFANDPSLAGTITEGKSKLGMIAGSRITGEGLKNLMRSGLNEIVRKRVTEYLDRTSKSGKQPDPGVLQLLARLASNAHGPTFGDLRDLSKLIPDVKELSVSASYMYEVDSSGNQIGMDAPQLAMFNANTEPTLEVAIAVQASAALPPIFKPVDIKLASGITARFQDGGVLNNIPNQDSLGVNRDLDPMPDSGSISFIFENEAAHKALAGQADPDKSRLNDWITDAPNSAANYATYRALADKPEDIVMVPLVFTSSKKNWMGKAEEKDFTGLLSGTANFDIDQDDRMKLQEMTEEATAAHITKRQQPKDQVFASMEQMLMCIGRADLVALVKDKLDGAKEALAFRDQVIAIVAKLTTTAAAMGGTSPKSFSAGEEAAKMLRQLDALAKGQPDREAFIGREMNRGGGLDRMITSGMMPGECIKAAAAVAEGLKAKAHVRVILHDMIHPRLIDEGKGINGTVLLQVEAKLHVAMSAAQVNAALDIAIRHYNGARDLLGVHGYKHFAGDLARYRM